MTILEQKKILDVRGMSFQRKRLKRIDDSAPGFLWLAAARPKREESNRRRDTR